MLYCRTLRRRPSHTFRGDGSSRACAIVEEAQASSMEQLSSGYAPSLQFSSDGEGGRERHSAGGDGGSLETADRGVRVMALIGRTGSYFKGRQLIETFRA